MYVNHAPNPIVDNQVNRHAQRRILKRFLGLGLGDKFVAGASAYVRRNDCCSVASGRLVRFELDKL